jgi:probable phosphoglycerate mutase
MTIKTTLLTSFFSDSPCNKPKPCCTNIHHQNLPAITPTPFYFLRHGQTDLNLERRHQGQQNAPLNATGKKEAHHAASILKQYSIHSICSSSLLRAQQTSEIIAEPIQCPIYYFEDLKERFKGQAEGQLFTECNFENIFSHITDEEPLGAESNKFFLNRTISGINKALEMPGPQLIVTHGAVLCCLCAYLKIELPDEIERANCLPLLFSPTENGWKITVLS